MKKSILTKVDNLRNSGKSRLLRIMSATTRRNRKWTRDEMADFYLSRTRQQILLDD